MKYLLYPFAIISRTVAFSWREAKNMAMDREYTREDKKIASRKEQEGRSS